MPQLNKPRISAKKFQFDNLGARTPKDYEPDRRKVERRVILVNSTKRLVHYLLLFIFFLVIGMSITGVIVYARFEDLNRKLMVEDISVPPIDISIDQPLDIVEEPAPERSRR